MTLFPRSYPSAQHLPFNSECLKGLFLPASPDEDPGGEGFWVPMRGTELLVGPGGSLPEGAMPEGLDPSPLYVGSWRGRPCRALALSKEEELPRGLAAENILATEPGLSLEILSLAGVIGQRLHWEKSSFCSRCGGGMERISGTWGKKCRSCGYAHFPHIHPCVIVLVRRGDELLLTRQPGWVEGRYGLVAGFLDFGECLEEAVAREVLEETGLSVENIRYVGSQCWPFPSQLMAGFVADYAGGEIVVEEEELEDARWFSLDSLPNLPPKRSIARYILDNFATG